MHTMIDFHVSGEKAVLQLDKDQLHNKINIHNSTVDPAGVIYLILSEHEKDQTIYWRKSPNLIGQSADLIILIQSDLTIENVDFTQFNNITVSDNLFCHDERFVIVENDKFISHTINFKDCQAINVHFFCNKINWLEGEILDSVSANLHGLDTSLVISSSSHTPIVIRNFNLPNNFVPKTVSLENVTISNNFSCEGAEVLSLKSVKSGFGICKLTAKEINNFSNFQNQGTELFIKAEIANIGSFSSPIGKVYIEADSFIDFIPDKYGGFQGVELHIDISKAIEKDIQFPHEAIQFDKIFIKGANNIHVPKNIIAGQIEIYDCSTVTFHESRIGHFMYKTGSGKLNLGLHNGKTTKIDSLWLIGNISAFFDGPTELLDLDSEGKNSLYIYDNYEGQIIKLNLNIDPTQQLIDSEKDGYFGLYINNKGDKRVEIGTVLGKVSSLNISGSVKLGQVIYQPIDSKYNLIEVNVKHLNNISINGFYAGFDHNIIIEKTNGRISLMQNMDRALTGGQIFATMQCDMQNFLTIRSGNGLSFHGEIKVVDGNIELYNLFGILSTRGSLSANKISLVSEEGSLDLTATFNAISLVTYSKGENYLQGTIINAEQFLAQTIGRYIQINTNIKTTSTTILSESNDLYIEASKIQSELIDLNAGADLVIKGSHIFSSQAISYSSRYTTIENSEILAEENLYFQSVANYLQVNSNILLSQYDKKLFLHHTNSTDNNGGPVAKCSISVDSCDIIGLVKTKDSNSFIFDELQYNLINSSNVDFSIFQSLASQHPKSVIIDAHSGIIMGSSITAKDCNVIIKTESKLELLPLYLHNAIMFGGGYNEQGFTSLISKIEAGVIDLNGGKLINLVGSLLKANSGSLKADYIHTNSFINNAINQHTCLQAVGCWLNRPELYDFMVNDKIVTSKLEFSEITNIDLGKGKIDLFYPYSSQKVYLRQRTGNINIDRDINFSNEVVAIHLDHGSIFIGTPTLKTFITGKNLSIKSGGNINIQQSVLKANNAYIIANNIEVKGSLIQVKNHLQFVARDKIRILPIQLIHSYYQHSGKTTIKEFAIKQVVAEINAGVLNIDAGRSAEFISALIQAEEVNIHVEDLNISAAKEIFDKQIAFRGKKKWHGGRNSWSSHDHTETVIPTEIRANNLTIRVDQDATIEAARIFAENDILMEIGHNLTIKDGYNIHIHDYHKKTYSLVSFGEGGMKFGTSKNFKAVNEYYDNVPTIICAGGTFYGIVDGHMHILGSSIIGNDIHIVAPKGLKLEASQYTDKKIIFASESGLNVGFYSKGEKEFGIRAAAYITKEQQRIWESTINSSQLVAANSLNIIAKDGNFEQISSDIAAKIIHVEARNWIAKTYAAEEISEHIEQQLEFGIKLGIKQNISSNIDKIKALIEKKGYHHIDQFDRIFKAYDVYKSLSVLPNSAASGRLYSYLDASQVSEFFKQTVAIDNKISGEDIIASLMNDIRFTGVVMKGNNIDLTANNFIFETSKDTQKSEYEYKSINIEIDLDTGARSNTSKSNRDIEISSTTHHHNYIKASGNLKISLSGGGTLKGISLEGANIEIKANNLLIESVQDKLSKRLQGFSMHVGFSQQYDLQNFGGEAESGTQQFSITKQVARVTGTQLVNILVKETLDIAGALIANAQQDERGNFTDKGNLSINCGKLIVKTIHDYDRGKTLGIGTSFQVNQIDGKDEISFSHAPVKYRFENHQSQVLGIIGNGQISSCHLLGDLNRNINHRIILVEDEKASFNAPIHGDMIQTLTNRQQIGPKTAQELIREQIQPPTIIAKLINYFVDVINESKQAGKDFVISGAKVVKMFGSNIDLNQLDKNIDQKLDWHAGLRLSSSEVSKIEELYAKYKADLMSKDWQGPIEYAVFFHALKDQVKQAIDSKNQDLACLKAFYIIYYNKYEEEAKAAAKGNRLMENFYQFCNRIYSNHIFIEVSFAAKVQKDYVNALFVVELFTNPQYNLLQIKEEEKRDNEPISENQVTKPKGEQASSTGNNPNSRDNSNRIEIPRNEVDVKLQMLIKEFVENNPEYAREIERLGYDEIKAQIIIGLAAEQDQPKDDSVLGYCVKEIFGISEAYATPLAIPVVIPVIAEIIKYGGAALIALVISAQLVIEKRRHDDKDYDAPTIKQDQQISGASFDPNDLEPDENGHKKEEKEKRTKDERKFNLDRNKSTDRNVLENLDTPVEDFIAKYRKGLIRREFPGEWCDRTVREVLEGNRNGIRSARTAKKLLIDNRFLK